MTNKAISFLNVFSCDWNIFDQTFWKILYQGKLWRSCQHQVQRFYFKNILLTSTRPKHIPLPVRSVHNYIYPHWKNPILCIVIFTLTFFLSALPGITIKLYPNFIKEMFLSFKDYEKTIVVSLLLMGIPLYTNFTVNFRYYIANSLAIAIGCLVIRVSLKCW